MKLTILSFSLLSALTAGAVIPSAPLRIAPQRPEPVKVDRKTQPAFNSENSSLKADFTVEGSNALAPVAEFGFDTDMQGWTAESTTYVEWSIVSDAKLGQGKGFSTIDPKSTGSLFVEGPYQVFRREKSSITSPEITVPANGSLNFYVGFSLNYDDMCRLILSVSTDNFATSSELWNSKDAPGEKPWAWREINIKLGDYVGKNIRLRFTYGPGSSDSFDTGGYMGDFAIDGLSVSGLKAVENIKVNTGDLITLLDTSEGNVVSREWNLPGAVPDKSTEKNPTVYYTADGSYDISLTVRDAEGNTSTKTRSAFVSVTGAAPEAKILPPATFRLQSNRKPLVAPLAPVTFRDASTNFPTEHTWAFSGVDPEPEKLFTSTEANPTVSYSYLHDQNALLISQNTHGTSQVSCDVTVEYSGVVNNLLPTDRTSVFDMEDWGVFPGSNTRKITAYAEKFSKPSVPVKVSGAYVFFQEAKAEDLVDQLANVGVHLYTSKDGKPDKKLDSWWWSVYELDLPSGGQSVGTSFPFTDAPIIDDVFFIVVDGIPAYTETTRVSFGMADFRSEGGTALMLKDGEWMEVADYFPAGKNHTSFMIYPAITHSVMSHLSPENGIATVNQSAGTTEFKIFSYMGYQTPVSDADWLRVVSEPNDMTVDTLQVGYDALPAALTEREGHITLTDGATKLVLTVHQTLDAGIDRIESDGQEAWVEYYNLQGLRVSNPTAGQILIRRTPSGSSKIRY